MQLNLFLQDLSWRYAVKLFDSTKKLEPNQLDFVLESFRLAPTSFGLQPYKLIVVQDQAKKRELFEKGGKQPQFKDCSHLLVFCAITNIDTSYVDRYINHIVSTRNIEPSFLEGFKKSIMGFVENSSLEQILAWSKNQAYLALGVVLSACAVARIDACPMEGFDADQFSKILNLDNNLLPVVLCAIGFRDENDEFAKMKKVRFDLEDLVQIV